MAYDEELAERVRDVLALRDDLVERRMFGGIAFLLAGNMACGALGDELIVRVGPRSTDGPSPSRTRGRSTSRGGR